MSDVWHITLTQWRLKSWDDCKKQLVYFIYFPVVGSLPVNFLPNSRLKHNIVLSLICPTPSLVALMEVYVPEQPVVALHGRDATLNCSFSVPTPFNLSDLSVFWQLTDTKRSVHAYWKGQDQLADQAERFANRTSLFPAQLGLGNTSLLLSGVVVADEGSYTCFVRVQDYGSAALLLQVAGESSCDVHDTCRNKQMNTHMDTYDQWRTGSR